MAFTPPDLAAIATAAGMKDVATAPDAAHAIARLSGPRGRVLVCGSLYYAGEILRDNA